MIEKIWKLYKISRPRFWMYSFGPLLIGLIAGYMYTWVTPDTMLWIYIWVVAIYTLIWSNIIIYWANDLADEETDALNDKKNEYEHRLQKNEHQYLKNSIYICIALWVLFLLWGRHIVYWGGDVYWLFWAYMLFLCTGIWYSVEPCRAKAKPFVDGISNILYIIPSIRWWMMITWSLEWFGWWGFIAWWLRAMAMHGYSAIPDIAPDQQVWLRTTAVVLWYRGTLLYCLSLWCLAASLAMWQYGMIYICLLIPYIVMIALSRRSDIMRRYRLFPWVNAVAGFALFWLIVLV